MCLYLSIGSFSISIYSCIDNLGCPIINRVVIVSAMSTSYPITVLIVLLGKEGTSIAIKSPKSRLSTLDSDTVYDMVGSLNLLVLCKLHLPVHSCP